MDIIVSHQLTDLDGLGAMVAANKMYPDAKPVFVGRLHRTVKDFLVLYKDEIEIYTLDQIDLDLVDRVIIVDTYKKDMLGDLNRKLDWNKCELIIYDHHPHQKAGWVSLDMSEELGSATTILVNRIVAEDLELNPFEATVCALGIYADTGNLTYLNTTASDAHALAYLLEAGANLHLINDFIKEPLNYYGNDTPYQHKHRYGSSMIYIIKKETDLSKRVAKLPENILDVLKRAGIVAVNNGVNAYLIGGMVRDMLLETENRDLDIAIDGSLESYIPELATELNGEYTYNSQFRTGNIKLTSGFVIDLAETRKEVYQYTGALPEVESSNMLEDLFRRDYTINALTICLNPDRWGILLDYFSAVNDLEDGLLRSLHRFSFLDDPTRIIRGIRLAARLNFSFEEETASLIKETIKTADFSRLSPERILKELELLFQNELTEGLFNLLRDYNIFKLLNINFDIKEKYFEQSVKLEAYLAELAEKNYNIEEWILRMAIFSDQLLLEDITKWNIKEKYKDILLVYNNSKGLLKELDKELSPVETVGFFSDFYNEQLIVLMLKADSKKARVNILNYLEYLQHIEININGNDLLELGMDPGPAMKEILSSVYNARLRGDITTRKEQLNYAEQLITDFT